MKVAGHATCNRWPKRFRQHPAHFGFATGRITLAIRPPVAKVWAAHLYETPNSVHHGFLPTRATLMLDTIFVAMFVLVLAMGVAIALVRFAKRYELHRKIQTTLAVVLLIAIVGFEIEMRFFVNWRELALASPFYASGTVDWMLLIHLCFAIPTPIVWATLIWRAYRHYDDQRLAGHAAWHRRWGRIAAGLMVMTSVTGCAFYWLAFAAT